MKPKAGFLKRSIKLIKLQQDVQRKKKEKIQFTNEFEMKEQISLHDTADIKRIINKGTGIYNQLYVHKFEK